MSSRVHIGELSIATPIVQFVSEALQDTGIETDNFWHGTEEIIRDLAPRNRTLLARRDEIQAKLDEYHFANPGKPEPVIYREFLTDIGYIVDEPTDFTITTSDVDSEIALQAGPQLIVPLLNARFSTNAANARWGSLYDALYGTDVIEEAGELARGVGYNPLRGAEVVRRGRALLDDAVPLASGSHADVQSYTVTAEGLTVKQSSGGITSLADPGQFIGYAGPTDAPSSVVMAHNGLHIEVQIDPTHTIGRLDSAGVKDIVIESALTSIMDLEDSVAAVDAEDKALGYRNWLHLSQGTLTAAVPKGDQTFTRSMNSDKTFSTLDGGSVTLRGRALMLIRNVGHLMTTDAVLDSEGNETPEGILDAIMTALGSMHDINGHSQLSNSRTGAMYIVKPKMHGPEEVAFTVELFRRVEEMLGLKPLTLKLGIMDEERRTTINLKACIEVAKDRVVFINTGFLDRTGDELHTSLLAGPMVRKADLKSQRFIQAYEDFNVDTGLAAGFQHKAQIGKGMWAMPNLMAAMLQQKSGHPAAGANTAWVPSPTAATLHALHYHGVNVFAVQDALKHRTSAGIDPILEIPLASNANWSRDEIATETDNNVQSILGYVVRWVDQGIGCSTVPDINNVGLMEDRATLRISSQLLANWLEHGIITEDDVMESMYRIVPIVDSQNAGDPLYEPLVGTEGPGLAFNAARDLVILGGCQPNGYTEPILHRARRAKKALRS